VYNLRKLVSLGLVARLRQGKYVRYYKPAVASFDAAILGAFRLYSERQILVALLSRPDLTVQELAKAMKLSRSTIGWHLRRLEAAGLIQARRDVKPISYRLVDSSRVSQLVLMFMPTTIDELANRFLRSFDAL
jgi:DNA-binding transcriptional ArsR family regulator